MISNWKRKSSKFTKYSELINIYDYKNRLIDFIKKKSDRPIEKLLKLPNNITREILNQNKYNNNYFEINNNKINKNINNSEKKKLSIRVFLISKKN